MIEILPATHDHAKALAPCLRAGDAMEVEALGFEPLEALEAVLAVSHEARSAVHDGQVAGMWGYAVPSLLGSTADLWMFTGHPADRLKVTLMRLSRDYVRGLRFARLRALVALDYTASVQWLRWLGFRDGPVEEYGGRMFMRMSHGI
jgi:hypothetical protein